MALATRAIQFAKDSVKRLLGERRLADRRVRRALAYGEPELALLPVLCSPDSNFLDVGANNGVYAWYAKDFAAHVYALEPLPATRAALVKLFGNSATVLGVAASNKVGTARLSIPVRGGNDVDTRCSLQSDANPGFATREIEVETRPIDLLGLTTYGCIKIDVEGHELAVLQGARETLARDRPTVIVECEERHNAGGVARCLAFMKEADYAPYFLQRGVLRDGSDFDASLFQKQEGEKQVSGGRDPDYVSNFIFIPTERDGLVESIRGFLKARDTTVRAT